MEEEVCSICFNEGCVWTGKTFRSCICEKGKEYLVRHPSQKSISDFKSTRELYLNYADIEGEEEDVD